MTFSEENYLKTIFHLTVVSNSEVSTNAIAEMMETKASSVTDMIKKLAEKDLVNYKKYQGVSLTNKGTLAAKTIVRRHRLWEVFLVEKLDFSWDEVHEVAEQLEHIKSEKLVRELDRFLGFPKRDPHGDPIPDAKGNFTVLNKVLLSDLKKGESGIFVGVKDSSTTFLQFLDKRNIALGSEIKIIEKEPFDQSVLIKINEQELRVSNLISGNIYIKTT
jgi:DtxR family Mn-dependent transcriptional regulator